MIVLQCLYNAQLLKRVCIIEPKWEVMLKLALEHYNNKPSR